MIRREMEFHSGNWMPPAATLLGCSPIGAVRTAPGRDAGPATQAIFCLLELKDLRETSGRCETNGIFFEGTPLNQFNSRMVLLIFICPLPATIARRSMP